MIQLLNCYLEPGDKQFQKDRAKRVTDIIKDIIKQDVNANIVVSGDFNNHMGFIVDDLEAMSEQIKASGGTFHRELKGGNGVDFERKFRDPNGIVFDISHRGWVGIPPDAP